MKNRIYKTAFCSTLALAALAMASASTIAQSPVSNRETASRINAANTLLRDGKVDEAIEAYHGIVPGDQQRNELNYNLAVAEYRKGNIDSAERLFRQVAETSSPALSSDSRYNLGNCHYAKALELAGNDKPAAIEHLRRAISNYRSSLRGNPNNPDARANIELAGELIRKLEKEQQREEQQEREQQPDKKDESEQQESEQLDKSEKSESQQSESQQSDSKQGESKQEKSQEDSEKQQSDAQNSKSDNEVDEQKKQDEASAPDQQSQDEQKQDQQKNGKPEPQQSEGQDNNQKEPQNRDDKSGQQQQPEDQRKPEEQESRNQQVPGGELKAAGEQDDKKKPNGSASNANPNAKDGLMTREEALKMLQAVRDRDMLRRLQQQRNERSRRVSVDRDW